MSIQQQYEDRLEDLTRKTNENDLLERQAQSEEDLLVAAAEEMTVATDSLAFLNQIANSRRGSMKGRIETILTEALQLVYGPGRKIELVYSHKNNRSHLAIELVKDTPAGEVRRVLDGTGAGLGVSDTVSVPLRLLVLLGSKQAERICILDECYKHVDTERVQVVTEFLRVLTERLQVQVIMLSHHESIRTQADAAFEVREGAKTSTVRPAL